MADPHLRDLILQGLSFLDDAADASLDHVGDAKDAYLDRISVISGSLGRASGPALEVYVTLALRAFRKAATLAPSEPWIWFQIGFWSFAIEGQAQDIDLARSALARTLELEPGNAAAHLALAYLRMQHGPYEDGGEHAAIIAEEERLQAEYQNLFDTVLGLPADADLSQFADQGRELTRRREALNDRMERWEIEKQAGRWLGPTGDYLQTAVVTDHLCRDNLFEPVRIKGTDLEVDYTPPGLGLDTALAQLDTLGKAIPEHLRPTYYNDIGLHFYDNYNDKETALPWFRKAVQWRSGDPDSLFAAYCHLGDCLATAPKPDHLGACEAYETSYHHLMLTPNRESHYSYWLVFVEILVRDWNPGPELARFLALCDRALDLGPFDARHPKVWLNKGLAEIAERAGTLLEAAHDLPRAEYYLGRAVILDPDRSSAAQRLSKIYIKTQRWNNALVVCRQMAERDPADSFAQLWTPILEVVVEKAFVGQALIRLLDDTAYLRGGQELILDELVVQRDLWQQVADAQRRAQEMLQRIDNQDRAYDDLIEELHNLVQKGSAIQPSAWRSAYRQLETNLGEQVWEALSKDSQHFLVTAEVFYNASRDIERDVDAAIISVEYAKAVETELRNRLFPVLEMSKSKPYKRRSTDETGIGAMGNRLKHVANGEEPRLLKFLNDLGFSREWLSKLSDDVLLVATRYRNGAAHTERMDRATVEEFRKLLYGGMLRRLAELVSKAESSDSPADA